MKKITIAVCATTALILIAAFLVGSFVFGNYSYYYTQIDNSKCQLTNIKNSIYYSYTLPSYNSDGNATELCFDAIRELRGGAFLKVKVSKVAGVVDWEEVQWNELPETIKNLFSEVRELE